MRPYLGTRSITIQSKLDFKSFSKQIPQVWCWFHRLLTQSCQLAWHWPNSIISNPWPLPRTHILRPAPVFWVLITLTPAHHVRSFRSARDLCRVLYPVCWFSLISVICALCNLEAWSQLEMLCPVRSSLPTLACPGYYCNLHTLSTAPHPLPDPHWWVSQTTPAHIASPKLILSHTSCALNRSG